MFSKKQLTTMRILKFLRSLLPVSLVAVIMLSGSHADTGTITGEAATTSKVTAIEFNNGKLSVSLDGIPLREVITEISRQTGIDIQVIGEYPAHTVNMQFSDSPLEKGLRLLLREASTIFIYADTDANGNHSRQLTKVFILPEGENGSFNDGIKQLVETLSGLPGQIQNSIPQSYKKANAHSSMNDPLTDQALYELSEILANRIINVVRTPNQ